MERKKSLIFFVFFEISFDFFHTFAVPKNKFLVLKFFKILKFITTMPM